MAGGREGRRGSGRIIATEKDVESGVAVFPSLPLSLSVCLNLLSSVYEWGRRERQTDRERQRERERDRREWRDR